MPATAMAAFNLKRKSDGTLYDICLCGCGEPNNPAGPTIFQSAKEAQEFVKFINGKDKPERYSSYGSLEGWHPAVHVDDTWKKRELERFKNGEYHPPVWYDEKWFQDAKERVFDKHFPHVSMKDPEHIAFTDTPEKGMQDVQTKIKPGRFLERFFGEVLTPEQIKEWAGKHVEEWSKGPELKLAATPDEIEAVYRMNAGFTSCMQKPINMFQPLINPTRVYGAGDLKVAYVTDKKGKLLARALCWPEKKKVGRIYGDAPRLRNAIEAALGFKTTSDNNRYDTFAGARLLRIEYEGGFIVPYLDAVGTHENYVEDKGEYLVISNGKGKQASSQHGYIGSGKKCVKCGSEINGRYYKVHVSNEDFGIAKRWCHNCVTSYGKSVQHEEGRYYVDPRYIPLITIAVYEGNGASPIAFQPIIAQFMDKASLVPDIIDGYYIKKSEAISVNEDKFIHKNRIANYIELGNIFRSDFDGKYYYVIKDEYRSVKVGKEVWTRQQAQLFAVFDEKSYTYKDARTAKENLFDEPISF